MSGTEKELRGGPTTERIRELDREAREVFGAYTTSDDTIPQVAERFGKSIWQIQRLLRRHRKSLNKQRVIDGSNLDHVERMQRAIEANHAQLRARVEEITERQERVIKEQQAELDRLKRGEWGW